MKVKNLCLNSGLLFFAIFFIFGTVKGQTVTDVFAVYDQAGTKKIQIAFDQNIPRIKIKQVLILDLDNGAVQVSNGGLQATPFQNIYEVFTNTPLNVTSVPNSKKHKIGTYQLLIQVEDNDGKIGWQNKTVKLLEQTIVENEEVRQKASDIDGADVYIDGDVKGSSGETPRFSTNIKLQKFTAEGKWRYTPYGYFKLNASTDPETDPDAMEFGFKARYIFDKPFYFDIEPKIESERDFGNTNALVAGRLTYVPAGSKFINTSRLFFRPFIGGEFGKNLRSPLQSAEGDGIARILAGADLRIYIPLNREKGRELNWTTSYTRRWLLSSELGFKADDDGNLQLVRFGRSPRDSVKSKIALSFNKFFGAFAEYDWGQVPPSYKFIDHRFRIGFFYKFKFGVE